RRARAVGRLLKSPTLKSRTLGLCFRLREGRRFDDQNVEDAEAPALRQLEGQLQLPAPALHHIGDDLAYPTRLDHARRLCAARRVARRPTDGPPRRVDLCVKDVTAAGAHADSPPETTAGRGGDPLPAVRPQHLDGPRGRPAEAVR